MKHTFFAPEFYERSKHSAFVEVFDKLSELPTVNMEMYDGGEFFHMDVPDDKVSRDLLSLFISDFDAYKTCSEERYNVAEGRINLCVLHEEYSNNHGGAELIWDDDFESFSLSSAGDEDEDE